MFVKTFLNIIFFLLVVFSGVSQAAEYEVKIRQINPDRAYYSTVCGDTQPFCQFVIPIESGRQNAEQSLTVELYFVTPVDVHFRFKWEDQYLHVRQTYSDYLPLIGYVDGLSERTALYIPHPQSKSDPGSSLVIRPGMAAVAELEIAVNPLHGTSVNGFQDQSGEF